MSYKLLLLALVAFSFLLAGCGGKSAEKNAPPAMEVSTPETAPAADPYAPQEPASGEKEELASLFDIEINEAPPDFEYGKAPGEE